MCRTHDVNAGMSKRKQSRYASDEGRSRPMQRTERGAQSLRSYGSKRYASNRWYAGRGSRPGSYMFRRFRGLPRASGLGIETKFFDTSLNASAVAVPAATAAWTGNEYNPATVLCLNAPTQGTGNSSREGRYITMESVQICGSVRWSAQADQVAADTIPYLKLWVVLDKQTNGGTATGLDSENVYTNPVATNIGGMQPLRNLLYSKRYKVLKEFTVMCPTLPISYDGTNIEQSGVDVPFCGFIDLKRRKTEFLGNAGTVADITTNGIFVCAASSSTQVTNALTYNARLRFRG